MGLGTELVQGPTPSGTSEPVCLGLILQPVAPPPLLCTLWIFILGEVEAGHSHHHMWLVAQNVLGPSYGFFLAVEGIFAVSRSQHSCAQACLFVFPPPLVGAELGYERGSCSFL
jgi:hypothetical protein